MSAPDNGPAPSWRLYRIPEAMQLLSLSRTVIYEQIRAGRLRSVRQGRARLIPADAIADYVALLITESGHDDGRPA
ncbi:helix-turn-helix domain-containing protein [Pseudonocardia sichuanensis]